MHSCWSLIPGGTTLFDVELESPLVAAPDVGSSWEILGSGLSLPGYRLWPDLPGLCAPRLLQCSALLYFSGLRLPPGGEDPVEAQGGEFPFTSHILGFQPAPAPGPSVTQHVQFSADTSLLALSGSTASPHCLMSPTVS